MALADAILACLTEHPMTGYELAKTFDSSIGFFWKADHQQIYRELSRLRDRGHIQGREVVQSGKPNKLVYTLTTRAKPRSAIGPPGRARRPRSRTISWSGLCARRRRHRAAARRPDGKAGTSPRPLRRYERILKKRFPLRATLRPPTWASCLGFASGCATSRWWPSGARKRSTRFRRFQAPRAVVLVDAARNKRLAFPPSGEAVPESCVYRPG